MPASSHTSIPRLIGQIPIIGTVLLALSLGGCGTVRLGYNNAPGLAYWWINGYLDLDPEQASMLRTELQSIQDWHRKQELPLLARQLAQLKARALQSTNADATCQLSADLQERYQSLVERTAPALVAMVPTLHDAQLAHLEREFEKRAADWQREHVLSSQAEQIERRSRQMVDRLVSFYGELAPEQHALVHAQVVHSDYDAAQVYRERLRRQQDGLEVLRKLHAKPGTPRQQRATIDALLQRTLSSPDPVYRQYAARVTQQNCTNLAALHNSMSSQQRAKLEETLQDYAQDLRALIKE